MDPISDLENALGAELLRARLLGSVRPKIGSRYFVERFLGRGATGLVVAALDERLGRAVALKLGIAAADTTMLSEARALALLDHPNVVRVHDVDFGNVVFDGKPFRIWLVSMQHVEGRNLRVWLREQPRTQREIVDVFIDAGRGLAAAHAAKIVHRDFKPDNVIVRTDGIAQVLDFGFAVPAASAESEKRAVPRAAAGTEPYMAPEARAGRVSRRSDQFSFGVSMVEAFTGEPRPAGKRRPSGISRALWTVLRRATAPEARRRFPEMAELIEALSREPRPSLFRSFMLGFATMVSIIGCVLAVAYAISSGWIERARDQVEETWRGTPDGGARDDTVDVEMWDGGSEQHSRTPTREADAALADADLDSGNADGPDGGLRCARLGGTHEFRTLSSGTGIRGCYRVVFGLQQGCTVDAQIEKTGSALGSDQCRRQTDALLQDVHVRFHLVPGGGAVARMSLLPRTYDLSFTLADDRLDGSFVTQNPGEPDDTGTIIEVP